MFINQDQITGLARIIVPVGVSYAVGAGWISANGAGDVTAAVLTIGASMWTIFAHTNDAKIAAVESMKSVTKVIVKSDAPIDDAAYQAALDRDRPKVSVEPHPVVMGTRPSATKDQQL